MEKQGLLKDYKRQEDKICLSQVLDKIEFAKVKGQLEHTDFLDMYQISLVENFLRKIKFTNYQLYGGYEEAERKVVIIYPEQEKEEVIQKYQEELLQVVRIQLPSQDKGKYTHRNYLGGIVKLSLEREKIGDILVFEEGADVITFSHFATILSQQLPSLTRFENSAITIEKTKDLKKREVTIEEIKIIVPSFRLDNFVSDLAKTSRNKATQIINQERVFINGKNETKASKAVKLNDIITIRGKGRFIIKQIAGTTRSGRSVVVIEKYT